MADPFRKRPRVVAITSEPPWPLNSGGHIRTFHLLRALTKEVDLQLICPVQEHQNKDAAGLKSAGIPLLPIGVPTRTKVSEAIRAARGVVRGQPYAMFARHFWPEVQDGVRRAVGDGCDVLYLDHLDSLSYLLNNGRSASPPAVIDMHNVYSLLMQRTAAEKSGSLNRVFYKREARGLARMEALAVRRCSKVFAVSDQEAAYFRRLGAAEVSTVPNGVDCGALVDLPVGRPETADILFLGTMSWEPNAAAARFLALDVMPSLRRQCPNARLLIVGREPPAGVRALATEPGVEVTGTVPDVKPYLARAALLAVPLDAGGGTRLKLLEAFAAGLPVVSTAVGAEGIAATPGVHYARAERDEFGVVIQSLLEQRSEGRRLALAARELATSTYDWNQIGAAAAAALRSLMDHGQH